MIHNPEELLENEWFIVRHSGEIPEIAYNSAIYFLTRAKNGPRLVLTDEQVAWLKKGAIARCREIILRDLLHCNINTSVYRGISRSIVNYHRYVNFCKRQSITDTTMREETAQAVAVFLATEVKELENKTRASVINCTFDELICFTNELGVEIDTFREVLEVNCQRTI